MQTLDQKPVIVVTPTGVPVSVGRFQLVRDALLDGAMRVEVVFETPHMACRLRVPASKVEQVKQTWNGEAFRYELPAGEAVWLGVDEIRQEPSPSPQVEGFPIPPAQSAAKRV